MVKNILILMKKDIELTEHYVYIAALILIVFPVFVNNAIKGTMDADYYLFLGISFCAFLMFGQIFLMESKNKGMTYLMACPYTKMQVALSRYIMLLIICIAGIAGYKLMEIINPLGNINSVSFTQTVFAVSIILLSYDILIPLFCYFPFEKIRIISTLVSIILPIWGTLLIRQFLLMQGVVLQGVKLPVIGALVLVALNVILMAVSIHVSKILLCKKEY